MGMVLRKILDLYVSSYQKLIKSWSKLLWNDNVLRILMKTLTAVDANTDAAAEGSTIALRERYSGELKMTICGHFFYITYTFWFGHNTVV